MTFFLLCLDLHFSHYNFRLWFSTLSINVVLFRILVLVSFIVTISYFLTILLDELMDCFKSLNLLVCSQFVRETFRLTLFLFALKQVVVGS